MYDINPRWIRQKDRIAEERERERERENAEVFTLNCTIYVSNNKGQLYQQNRWAAGFRLHREK